MLCNVHIVRSQTLCKNSPHTIKTVYIVNIYLYNPVDKQFAVTSVVLSKLTQTEHQVYGSSLKWNTKFAVGSVLSIYLYCVHKGISLHTGIWP